jgi:hypothetical protein
MRVLFVAMVATAASADAQCYDAQGVDCSCICGGRNHGAGLERVRRNTLELSRARWVHPRHRPGAGAVVTDPKKPGCLPTLTLKGKSGKPVPKAAQKPAKQKPAPKPKGPAYTPPRQPVERMDVFWMVYRDNGRRPRARHSTLEGARFEAQRIAAQSPGAQVWVIRCEMIETHSTPALPAPTGSAP